MSALDYPNPQRHSRAWCRSFLADSENLPFSFVLAGKKIQGIPADWSPCMATRQLNANLVQTRVWGVDAASGLRVEFELDEYLNHPVAEWVVWFEQQGKQSSPLLEALSGCDLPLEGETPELWSCNGDYYSKEGYTPSLSKLNPDEKRVFAPQGGRPCDQAFPYFRLKFAQYGVSLAVGWPAQWEARFSRTGEGVRVWAGQQLTHLLLHPGERIRTPRITLLAWEGNHAQGINQWRRWYMDCILPKPDGKSLQPKVALASTEGGEEFTNASEKNQIRLMKKARKLGYDFDIWWIDAGWYPCRDETGRKTWWKVGNLYPDPERFPNGFAKVSREARRSGANLLVWFEPERVFKGTEIYREKPQWLLHKKGADGAEDNNSLLNLGIAECREWLTERVNGILQQGGIGVYRQDFNFEPLAYWRGNDAAERQGMLENLHVQGYLRYWDELLRQNPGLWIDSCASGGRRNDLETMRRAVPLHYTDYGYGDHAVKLAFHRTLFEWIPFFKDATVSWDQVEKDGDRRFDDNTDSYSVHCALAGMLFVSQDLNRDDYDSIGTRKMIEVWRQAAPYLYGDYFQHTPFSKSESKWVAWEFVQPDGSSGMVQALRLKDCPQEEITLKLKGADAQAQYRLENPESGEEREVSGKELRAGLTLRGNRRSGQIWLYFRD